MHGEKCSSIEAGCFLSQDSCSPKQVMSKDRDACQSSKELCADPIVGVGKLDLFTSCRPIYDLMGSVRSSSMKLLAASFKPDL